MTTYELTVDDIQMNAIIMAAGLTIGVNGKTCAVAAKLIEEQVQRIAVEQKAEGWGFRGRRQIDVAVTVAGLVNVYRGILDILPETSATIQAHDMDKIVSQARKSDDGFWTLVIHYDQCRRLMESLESQWSLGSTQIARAFEMYHPSTSSKYYQTYHDTIRIRERQYKDLIFGPDVGSMYLGVGCVGLPPHVDDGLTVFQVVRHRLAWDKNPEGGIFVSFDTPMQYGVSKFMPKIRAVDAKSSLTQTG